MQKTILFRALVSSFAAGVTGALVHPVISPFLSLSLIQSTPDTLLISPLDLTMFTTEESSKREREMEWTTDRSSEG